MILLNNAIFICLTKIKIKLYYGCIKQLFYKIPFAYFNVFCN